MKKLVLSILTITVFLTGCGESDEVINNIPKDNDKRFNGVIGEVNIITDSETNCKYIYIYNKNGYSSTSSMSPLMKNKTEVDCG